MDRPVCGLCQVWLWRVLWGLCCSIAASMATSRTLFVVMLGRGGWRGGSGAHLAGGVVLARSLRRHRRAHQSFVQRGEGGGSEGGRRRALHDPISYQFTDSCSMATDYKVS